MRGLPRSLCLYQSIVPSLLEEPKRTTLDDAARNLSDDLLTKVEDGFMVLGTGNHAQTFDTYRIGLTAASSFPFI